jgi:hypothetical protein
MDYGSGMIKFVLNRVVSKGAALKSGKTNPFVGSVRGGALPALSCWEKPAIIGLYLKNPLEGYGRLTFMMRDADIVAVSPSSAWRVLSQAGPLSKWNGKLSTKGTGFAQPLAPHQHWHIDVSYLNIGGTF